MREGPELWAQLYQENTAHKASLNCCQTSGYDNENVAAVARPSSNFSTGSHVCMEELLKKKKLTFH